MMEEPQKEELDPVPDDLFVESGRMLAALKEPMTQEDVRRFATNAVDEAAKLDSTLHYGIRFARTYRSIQPELTRRGALRHHIDHIAKAILHAVDHSISLVQARWALGSVWAGVLTTEN